MKYILSPSQMRMADKYGIETIGIPSIVLMENAARSSSEIINSIAKGTHIGDKVVVLCGAGNNGGDGFAIARHLHSKYTVNIIFCGSVRKMTEETKINSKICKQLGISIQNVSINKDISTIPENVRSCINQADIIIDALIGIGNKTHQIIVNKKGIKIAEPMPNREIPDGMDSLLSIANTSSALKIAIDIPTGLKEYGNIGGQKSVFKTDHTITMAAIKTSLLLNDAWRCCGKIHIADIGLPEHVIAKFSKVGMLEETDIEYILPKRNVVSSKLDYGRVCVIAGSKRMPGAGTLCANSAIRSGAGIVELCTTEVHPALLPEIIPNKLEPNQDGCLGLNSFDAISESCERADVIIIGCGLGINEDTLMLCTAIIQKFLPTKKIVADADATRCIKVATFDGYSNNLVITPHIGEFKRMNEKNVSTVLQDSPLLVDLSEIIAKNMNCIVVLKSFPVFVTNGNTSYWCTEGNPGMATAGSGDVLAGVIAGMLCRIPNTLDAASLGVYFHAKAGSYVSKQISHESLTASVISENLRYVMP